MKRLIRITNNGGLIITETSKLCPSFLEDIVDEAIKQYHESLKKQEATKAGCMITSNMTGNNH